MITKAIAVAATYRQEFYHVSLRNADGSAVRCRVNGKCKTWKTDPDRWRLPVIYGLKGYFALGQGNAKDWLLWDPTDTYPIEDEGRGVIPLTDLASLKVAADYAADRNDTANEEWLRSLVERVEGVYPITPTHA